MKTTASALILAAALLSAACGEGRAIFNVDVHSFIEGTGDDTIPYAIPPATSDTVSNDPQEITLPPGFGSSIVDSVRFTGSVTLLNTAGTGTIGFQLYLGADSASTFDAAALAIDIPPTSVSDMNTYVVAISGDVSGALKDLFSQSSIWLRAAAIGINPGATLVTGDGVITALQLRVVFQDKLF